MKNPCDVVLYGATGSAGRQAAAYLDRQADRSFRWAIAGRNTEKLERLRASLRSAPDVIVADAGDDVAVDEMVGRARVVLTTAGPFAVHGEALIRSCACHGVDYVDITGETPWARRMIDRYHDMAAESGAKVVSFCGFDAVPSDLGTYLLVEHFRQSGRGTREVRAFHRAPVNVNSGTVATISRALESGDIRAIDDPFLLCPDEDVGAEERFASRDPMLPVYDPDLGRWVAPSLMARINTRVVRRSSALSSRWQAAYGENFRYREYWDMAAPMNFLASGTAAIGVGLAQLMSMMPTAGRFLDAFARASGEGPNADDIDAGYFECRLFGVADDAATAWGLIAGEGDPASNVTAMFLCEGGMALAFERDRLPGGDARAGLLTPATAFGDVLVARLRRAGLTIECPIEGGRS